MRTGADNRSKTQTLEDCLWPLFGLFTVAFNFQIKRNVMYRNRKTDIIYYNFELKTFQLLEQKLPLKLLNKLQIPIPLLPGLVISSALLERFKKKKGKALQNIGSFYLQIRTNTSMS